MKEISKEVLGGEICINKNRIEISTEEFDKISEILSAGKNKGFIQTRKGDWVNLAFVSEIKKINSKENKKWS